MILHAGEQMVWTCPNPENLTVASETLTFSHGSSIPGKWFMVATLDAMPVKASGDFTAGLMADFAAKPMVKQLQIWTLANGRCAPYTFR